MYTCNWCDRTITLKSRSKSKYAKCTVNITNNERTAKLKVRECKREQEELPREMGPQPAPKSSTDVEMSAVEAGAAEVQSLPASVSGYWRRRVVAQIPGPHSDPPAYALQLCTLHHLPSDSEAHEKSNQPAKQKPTRQKRLPPPSCVYRAVIWENPE